MKNAGHGDDDNGDDDDDDADVPKNDRQDISSRLLPSVCFTANSQ